MRRSAAFAVVVAMLPSVAWSKPASKVFGPGGIRVLEAPTAKDRQRECRRAKAPKGCAESDEAFIQLRLARVARQAKAIEARCVRAAAHFDPFDSLLLQFVDLRGDVGALTRIPGQPTALEVVLAELELLDARERCLKAWQSPQHDTVYTFNPCNIGGGCWHAYSYEPPEFSFRDQLAAALDLARTRTGLESLIARGEERLRFFDETRERWRKGLRQCLIDCQDAELRKRSKPEMVPPPVVAPQPWWRWSDSRRSLLSEIPRRALASPRRSSGSGRTRRDTTIPGTPRGAHRPFEQNGLVGLAGYTAP